MTKRIEQDPQNIQLHGRRVFTFSRTFRIGVWLGPLLLLGFTLIAGLFVTVAVLVGVGLLIAGAATRALLRPPDAPQGDPEPLALDGAPRPRGRGFFKVFRLGRRADTGGPAAGDKTIPLERDASGTWRRR